MSRPYTAAVRGRINLERTVANNNNNSRSESYYLPSQAHVVYDDNIITINSNRLKKRSRKEENGKLKIKNLNKPFSLKALLT